MNAVFAMDLWDTLEDCLRASQPIVVLLRLVDCKEKLVMGYIAHAFKYAWEKIVDNFHHEEKDYKSILEIVDRHWALNPKPFTWCGSISKSYCVL